jgi:hypothetical protein
MEAVRRAFLSSLVPRAGERKTVCLVLRLESTTRRSLILYGALLVLPTLIFGWLYWSELQKDFERDRNAIPEKASAGARRIVSGMNERLQRLVDSEAQRPFTHYAKLISPEDVMGDQLALQTTPLERSSIPVGVLGWFSFDRPQGPDSQPIASARARSSSRSCRTSAGASRARAWRSASAGSRAHPCTSR